MPRPTKCRRVCYFPEILEFSPAGEAHGEPITLTVDEFETITVLLPSCVDNASANDSSTVISHFKSGIEGIFLLNKVTEDSCSEMNGKTFYYDDICDYFMFGEDQFAIIVSDGTIRFNADMFDGETNAFATLDEAESKIQAALTKE